jgi:nucleotide sugar dehydrogenase
VIGLGYVGLTLALKLASHKRRVIGVETNPQIVLDLKNGISHIQEPGIENLLENLVGVNFNLISDLQALKRPEGVIFNFFICVGTPKTEDYESLNMDFTWEAVRAVAKIIRPGDAIIQRSTVPVGTGIAICNELRDEYGFEAGQGFHYIAAPERTIEGDALNELHALPQLLAGATSSCYNRGEHIFRGFVRTVVPFSSLEACELAKIATNAYRDYTFAFANYLASICRPLKIDVNELIAGANFGYARASIPDPSPGVGGPCLSKDPYLLNYVPSQFDSRESPVVVARKFNEIVPLEVSNFLSKNIPDLKSKEVLIIGMAFKGKPEVKDLRNSTSADIAILMNGICGKLYAVDAVSDLASIDFAHPVKYPNHPSDQISVFMILNNHQQNRKILDFYLSKVKAKHLWVFDPWRLVDTNSLNVEKDMVVTFINLSSTSNLNIGGKNE